MDGIEQLTTYLDELREDADFVSFSGATVKPLIEVIDAALNLADVWEKHAAEKRAKGEQLANAGLPGGAERWSAEGRTLEECAGTLREYMATTLLRTLP